MRLPKIDFQTVQGLAKGVTSRFAKKAPQIDSKVFKNAYGRMDCALSDFITTTTVSAQKKYPKLFENVGDLSLAKRDTFLRRIFEAGRDFLEIPFDILSEIASKFPKSKLNNSQFLQNHRAHIMQEKELAALQGLRDMVPDVIEAAGKSGVNFADVPERKGKDCSDSCKFACNAVGSYLNGLLNDTMEFGNSTFDTKKERFNTRIVSGFLPAFFLGADYYNKAKLKGKSDEEALKAQHGKQLQEIKESTEEGVLQYVLNASCSEFVNKNMLGPVISGLVISTISRIHSRLSSGRPIKRVKTPENSMVEFVKAAQTGVAYKTQSEIDKEAKPPLLSMKNILAACGIAITAAYLLRFASNLKVGKKLLEPIRDKMTKFELSNIEDVVASKTDIDKFKEMLGQCSEGKYAEWIEHILESSLGKNWSNANLGTRYKTTKLFGLFEVRQKDLKTLPLMPFKFVKEVVSYPYMLVHKIECAIRKIKPSKSPLKDNYNFKNVYLKYKEFEKKFGADPDKFKDEFDKYLREMRIASLNKKTSSKVDNTTVAAVAQVTGSLSGIWFNMNDDYNAAIKNGENRAEARKAARLRGINKIARTTSQAAIWGTLKELFKKQCNGSFTGSMIMVAISGVLTDMASRLLTAMPIRKMKTKEELEAYQKSHKEGAMAWYYNGIDKLAS